LLMVGSGDFIEIVGLVLGGNKIGDKLDDVV
jgi:hypothetical protein